MTAFLKNIRTLSTDSFARYCFFNGIGEPEKERLYKLSLGNPFAVLDITKTYVASGRDFEALEKLLEQVKN